ADAHKLASAAVYHDMHETRLLDLNKITARYVKVDKKLERQVEEEQTDALPNEIKKSINELLELDGKELIILKDADYLECAFQAKEYTDSGYSSIEKWLDSIEKKLQTKSAKELLKTLKEKESGEWTNGLKVEGL
ncbi:hypothetical protein HZC07_00930, partial [Candidatus Micrarchaeota archaeon]|nr:hypothetical protein [Candidatus Micrarchaeota archaeon]